jgi:cytochrome c553
MVIVVFCLAAAPDAGAEKWAAECSGCHVAYPARFLPAATWTRLMAGLDKHFGSDASVDPESNREIGRYLVANAAGSRSRSDDPASLRISDTRWFRHKHSEEMDPAIFKSPLVKSASNCGACHQGVARADYSEHNVRIPGQAGRSHNGRERDDDDD